MGPRQPSAAPAHLTMQTTMQSDFCPGFSKTDIRPKSAFIVRVYSRLIFCAVVLLCLSAGAQQKVDSVQESQKKARAVLDRMIKAMGGQAGLNVQDLKSEVRYGSFI